MDSLVKELEEKIEGEVRFDRYTKALYSTDASIYQIDPIGVVIPKHEEDILTTIRLAANHAVPVLPRGGGTSLSGQAVGKAIVMDTSKYMDRILEVNPEERWARVQPGVVLDQLNDHLRANGLWFAPDVSTSSRATIGGMVGNNAAGSRSIIYGKTVDHVKELTVALSDGGVAVFGEIGDEELKVKLEEEGIEGHIYREVLRIIEENREEIPKRFPNILRRVSGYNLDELLKDGPLNLAKLIVGSEGTLAIVTEAKVNLVPRPKMTAQAVVHFSDLLESLQATVEILKCDPAAVELVDKMILDLTKDSLEYSRRMNFVKGDPRSILLVEFHGESKDELISKIEGMEKILAAAGLGGEIVRVLDKDEQANIQKVRKAGLGLLLGMKGDTKPTTFVEDTAVSPEVLPDYVRKFRNIVEKYNTTAAFYGHASVGCLHIRPLINMKIGSKVKEIRSIAEEVYDLVLEYGGSISGEHGDGLVRSEWISKMFGPQLYGAFRQVKTAFDPKWIMNPGKIVDAPPMTENLRYGESYETMPLKTYFKYSQEGGFAKAIELCNGVGACRKTSEGTMCPSYLVTREEEHTTRGRANALRMVISGALPHEEFTGKRLYEVLDLCLECKGCKGECPSNVDMAKFKYEFLASYQEKHGVPLRSRLFANIEKLNKLGCALSPLSNWVAANPAFKWTLQWLTNIERRRTLPTFAHPTFRGWFKSRGGSPKKDKKVVLFDDTYTNYNHPSVGMAAVKVLEAAGFQVILPSKKKCCGRPMISKGLLKEARSNAEYNIDGLFGYVEHGYPIVGLEPSCITTFRDEYPDLVDDDRAEVLGRNVLMIDEFLSKLQDKDQLDLKFTDLKKDVLYHGHCYQKALIGTAPSLFSLRLPSGYRVEEIESGCCGMAGSFGYEAEHYDLSLKVGGVKLFPAVESRVEGTEVAVAGISCRHQIEDGTGVKPRHLIEILADAL